MKIIQYRYCGREVRMLWSEVNEQIAMEEAEGGEYAITEDADIEIPLTLEERVRSLEKTVSPGEYTAGVWYYRGDRVSFEGAVYTCIAPDGVVCVWSPGEYAQYWEKNL